MGNEQTYQLSLLISVIMGIGLYHRTVNRAYVKRSAAFLFPLLSAVLVPLCARMFYFLARVDFLLPTQGWAGLFDFRPEGMAYTGSIIGLWMAGYLTSKIIGIHYNKLLDAVTPGALLALMLSRLAEYFVSFGQGSYIESVQLQFFPLAVKNEWGEWYYAVFMLEALFALLILIDALKTRERSPGYLWQKALLFLFCSQILCESLRAETLKWGFVRVYQVFCAAGIIWFFVKWSRRAMIRGVSFYQLLPFLAGMLVIILSMGGIEYALDKWLEMPHWALYLAMSAGLSTLAVTGARLLKRSKGMLL